jgi:hypothetical protein
MSLLSKFQKSSSIQSGPPAGLPWRIFLLSLVVLGLTVLVYAGMSFGYVPYLKSEVQQVDAKFKQLSQSIDDAKQQELLKLYSQLYNIKTLSTAHVYPSRFFDFLERATYPAVRITSLVLNIKSREARLEGIALASDILTTQLAAIQESPEVESIELDAMRQRDAKEGGGVTFSVKVLFVKDFFSHP